MFQKNALIKGTVVLTLTGILTRILGFYYRIFLSHTFGEEGVGLYQLIFPVYALCFSLTAAGIEAAISRYVARSNASGDRRRSTAYLLTGMSVSFVLSCICMLLLQRYSPFLAERFLGEPRCAPLLSAMAYSFPFAAVHSCLCGYYLGLKRTRVPAMSQLFEQIARVGCVMLLCSFAVKEGQTPAITFAVLGLVFGEIISSIYSIHFFLREQHKLHLPGFSFSGSGEILKQLLTLSVPLTANRILLNLLQSIEAVSIPHSLQQYGATVSESLALYGVLTGMALPCILFPSAITNSMSSMLLPAVAELQATNDSRPLKALIKRVSAFCLCIGCLCCLGFLLTGNFIGVTIFHSSSAGTFIQILSWMCPFLYLNTALTSVLNGLGRTGTTLVINSSSLTIRILSVFLIIPQLGMRGYLYGMLASQLLVTVCAFLVLQKALES